MMRLYIIFSALVWSAFSADVIPASARPDFTPGTYVGVSAVPALAAFLDDGGIPTISNVHSTITATGDTTDRTSAINNAITAAAAVATVNNMQAVVLGNGDFTVTGQISLIGKNYVELRGSGGTTIKPTTQETLMLIGQNAGGVGSHQFLASDGLMGATSITVTGTSASVGDLVYLSREQVDTETVPAVVELNTEASGGNLNNQIILVTGKTGDTITFHPPLAQDYPTSLNASIRSIPNAYGYYQGVRDITVDNTGASLTNVFNVTQAVNCWLKNVRVIAPRNHVATLETSLNIEIRKCTFEDAVGVGDSNFSTVQIERTTGFLIEDNIFHWCFPHVQINGGSTYGAVTYNYMGRNSASSLMGCSIDLHGPHPNHILIEGNFSSMFQADGYHGSASKFFLVRNRFHGTNELGHDDTDTNHARALDINRLNRAFYIVGNILGVTQDWWDVKNPGVTLVNRPTLNSYAYSVPIVERFGYPNMGNNSYIGKVSPLGHPDRTVDIWADYGSGPGGPGFQELDLDVLDTSIVKGNWDGVTEGVAAGESLGSDTVATSYIHSSKPSWFGSLSWPPYEASTYTFSTVEADAVKIPAGWRATNGNEDYISGSPTYSVGRLGPGFMRR